MTVMTGTGYLSQKLFRSFELKVHTYKKKLIAEMELMFNGRLQQYCLLILTVYSIYKHKGIRDRYRRTYFISLVSVPHYNAHVINWVLISPYVILM